MLVIIINSVTVVTFNMNPPLKKSSSKSLAGLLSGSGGSGTVSAKASANGGKAATVASSGTLVPPVLQEVSRLAAGVAAVSTAGLIGAPGQQGGMAKGSATGNPRNKCALEPGHSLMDWIRLGASGKDLTGLGPSAGKLQVTLAELKRHNTREDAWIVIRGNVYNVTHYLPFHPGGVDELMRGVGSDATPLFDQIHPWVNYQQILQKCFVGRLVGTNDQNINTANLFQSVPKPGSGSKPSAGANTPSENDIAPPNKVIVVQEAFQPPRQDWIQKTDSVTVIFYTRPHANPSILLLPTPTESLLIQLTYSPQNVYTYCLHPPEAIVYPGVTRINYETGKVELTFRKQRGAIWSELEVTKLDSGEAEQMMQGATGPEEYRVMRKEAVSHDVCLLELGRLDGGRGTVPLGRHMRVTAEINGESVSKSYTAVPKTLFTQIRPLSDTTDTVCLMIKSYAHGTMSKYMCERQESDIVNLAGPYGGYDLAGVKDKESVVMLAAGTGITPMFNLMTWLLERRQRKSSKVTLMFFNKAEEDILFKNQFDSLQKQDNRFNVEYILSRPSKSWDGPTGRVSTSLLKPILEEHTTNTGYSIKQLYFYICGPAKFTELSSDLLISLGVEKDQIHQFLG